MKFKSLNFQILCQRQFVSDVKKYGFHIKRPYIIFKLLGKVYFFYIITRFNFFFPHVSSVKHYEVYIFCTEIFPTIIFSPFYLFTDMFLKAIKNMKLL